MPTGYTNSITDTMTLREFALHCARAFGALVTMREEPGNAPIPEKFAPSEYYLRCGDKARTEHARVYAMTDDEAQTAADTEYEADCAGRLRYIQDSLETERRYRRMLEMIAQWQPPTDDHVALKEFMVQQIMESIKFDCSYVPAEIKRKTGAEWKGARLITLASEVVGYDERHAEEVQRAEERTTWVQKLRESLP